MQLRHACTVFLIFFFAAIHDARADAEQDWQAIVALDAGPQSAQWKSRDEARSAALAHLSRQEKALRDFMAKYTDDARRVDAQLRLAHLLTVRGDLEGNSKARAESTEILRRLERNPATPKDRLVDIEFAKLSLFMRRIDPASADAGTRQTLLNKARTFQKAFPQDRRIAALLAEVATLHDAEPRQKKALLAEALTHTSEDAQLRQRIEDDLKRLAMLGKPVEMRWASPGGEEIDLAKLRGKVVLIYFFAGWSPPSIAALDWARDLAARFPSRDVQPLGFSLDEDRRALDKILAEHRINWPVYFDGKGWEGSLVRSLGINSLPTLWIVDRQGNLRTLNARGEADSVITQLLRER